MSIRPMISALRFSRLTVFFLILETVVACAFLCNALAFIAEQAGPMLAATGVAPGQVLYVDHVQFTIGFDPKTHAIEGGVDAAQIHTLETRIRALPGVKAVSVGENMPYTSVFRGSMPLHAVGGGTTVHTSLYEGDNVVHALGLELIRGRNFTPTEIGHLHAGMPPTPTVVIITDQVARRLFPDGDAVGQRITCCTEAATSGPVVIGVVRHLPSNQPVNAGNANMAIIQPLLPAGTPTFGLIVRTTPVARAAVARQLPAVIQKTVLPVAYMQPRVRTFEAMHHAYYRANRSMVWLMLGVTFAVIAITVIGVMGLTGFWVQRRTRTIGIRRALGATRGCILRYFLIENFLVVGVGVALGVLAAYAGNLWLMGHLEMPRLPWMWLPIGAALLWVLGQLAVLSPARRAAAVPPVVATRSV